jgi:hypothetical protein
MTWLVWRQHRFEILGLLVGATLIAASLVYGADLAVRTRIELGVDTCRPVFITNANCVELAVRAGEALQPFRWLITLLFFLPAIVGSFVGGPLFAREIERGTHRLIWTQGITRLRWASTKLGAMLFVGAAAAIVALVGGRAATITGSSSDAYQNFAIEGPPPVAYAVFAMAVAAFAGTLTRRILGGMLIGLIAFGVVRMGTELALRPNYEPPVTVVLDVSTHGFQMPKGAWLLTHDHIDSRGDVVPRQRMSELTDACSVRPDFVFVDGRWRPPEPGPATGKAPFLACLAEHGVFERLRYQPADRYSRFQWTETGLFLGLAGILSAATVVLLRRRDA